MTKKPIRVDFTGVGNPTNIPRELTKLSHWVCWRRSDEGKKLPVDPKSGKLAKSNDSTTWSSYKQALKYLQDENSECSGIGFVLNGGDYSGVDLDDCRDATTGSVESWAREIIDELDSYTEASPSGTGVHIFVKAKPSSSAIKKKSGKIELYHTLRYLTVTGDVLDGRKTIRKCSLASLEARMASSTSADSDNSTRRSGSADKDTSASGAAFARINEAWKKTGRSMDADVVEAMARQLNPHACKQRDAEKGNRAGLTNTRYDVEQLLRRERGNMGEKNVANRTDVGNSQRLAALYGEDMHYCAEQKVWYCWDGRRWEKNDPTGRIMSFAKKVALSILGEAQQAKDDDRASLAKWSITTETRTRLESMIALCRDLEPIRLEMFSSFNRDLNLVNFKNGTMDLRTGQLREHRREDLITKILEYDYRPEARCARFVEFVGEAIGKENVPFLQKCLGYSLTGDTREKKLFLCCGARDRGKTTLLEIISEVLGDLCASLNIESLLCSERFANTTNIQADLADLAGARFVISSEPERRAKLSCTRIKNLTKGQGSLKAVRKYENWIEFPETYKIWLDMNSLPSVEDDDATWARLVPIPFQAPKRLDRKLKAKLRAEAEGILTWLVQGAKLWYAEGLELPQRWENTRTNWRKHENKFQQFLDDCCIIDRKSQKGTLLRDLTKAQNEWAVENKTVPLNDRTISASLQEMQLTRKKAHGGAVGYRGIALKVAVGD